MFQDLLTGVDKKVIAVFLQEMDVEFTYIMYENGTATKRSITQRSCYLT
jgi:hypothetical protein